MNTGQSDEQKALSVLADVNATGPELLETISNLNTLNLLLDRDPWRVPPTDDELMSFIVSDRQARASWEMKQEGSREKRKAKRRGE